MDRRVPGWYALAHALHPPGCLGLEVSARLGDLLRAGFIPPDEVMHEMLRVSSHRSCCEACWRVADAARPRHGEYLEKMVEGIRHHYASALTTVRASARASAWLALPEAEREQNWEETSRGEAALNAADFAEGLRLWDGVAGG